jgi:site-specific DNA-cytosine methylase
MILAESSIEEALCIRCLAQATLKTVKECRNHTDLVVSKGQRVHLLSDSDDGLPRNRKRVFTHKQVLSNRARWMRSYQKHKERRMKEMRERYQAKIEEERAKNRAYYAKNKEAINAKRRKPGMGLTLEEGR